MQKASHREALCALRDGRADGDESNSDDDGHEGYDSDHSSASEDEVTAVWASNDDINKFDIAIMDMLIVQLVDLHPDVGNLFYMVEEHAESCGTEQPCKHY